MSIAIVGMACRFPEAANLAEFRRNLQQGRDSVRPLSLRRKLATTIPLDRHYQIMGCMEDIDLFDAAFFDIAPAEAEAMDPHQRILLEVVYEALESTGRGVHTFSGSRSAVFVGDANLFYYTHAESHDDPLLLAGNLNSAAAGRIARSFNLTGTAAMVDTACSSSLVAVHLAANELILGDADFAIACGATLGLFPGEEGKFTQVGVMSADGKARAFSSDATGTSNGEAAVCVVLRPLADALRDGDLIYAVLKGSAVNQDARRSASLTAPDSRAQAEVIERAWRKAGVSPDTIGYIETHGTATKLGDPIEIAGIDGAFSKSTPRRHFCQISSLKSNIGHSGHTAGIAGLAKAVLSLRHREFYPSLHFREPNPFIDFANSATTVTSHLSPWPDNGSPRRAGVSSFGLSGTNCHVVLEEAPALDQNLSGNGPWLFTVSARSPASLRANLRNLAAHFDEHPGLDPAAVSYTLNAGRTHYAHRWAFVASSLRELRAALLELPAETPPASRTLWHLFPARVEAPAEVLVNLSERYPAFAAACRECRTTYPDSCDTDVARSFAYQFALYQTLKAFGVATPKLIGQGAGNLVSDSIAGARTLAEALRAATHREATSSLAASLESFLSQRHEACVVVPMGSPAEWLGSADPDGVHRVLDPPPLAPDPILALLRDLYLVNFDISFDSLQPARIELPGYAFTRKRFWLKSPEVVLERYTDAWFYELSWTPIRARSERPSPTRLRLLGAPEGDASDLARAFERLGVEIVAADSPADGMVDLRAYAASDEWQSRTIEKDLDTFLYPIIDSLRLLEDRLRGEQIPVCIVTRGAEQVLPDDPASHPVKQMLSAAVRTVASDYPNLRLSITDVDCGASADSVAASILQEFTGDGLPRTSAYRNGVRYAPSLRSQPPSGTAFEGVRKGAAYLITGGTSGVGAEIAKSLAASGAGMLVLAGRSPSAPAELLRELARHGAQVEYRAVDLADRTRTAALFDEFAARQVLFDGIMHLAGDIGSRKPLLQCSRADLAQTLRAKVQGTIHLHECSRAHPLRFFVLFSSLNSLVPQKQTADYALANAFENAFAIWRSSLGLRTLSILWPGWWNLGAPARVTGNQAAGIATIDGVHTLHRALAACNGLVAVSPDPPDALNVNPYVHVSGVAPKPPSPSQSAAPPDPAPQPVSTLEGLRAIWGEVLSADSIRDDDDFFDLGGNSLSGTRVINRIRQTLGAELTFEVFYDNPQLRSLASHIDELQPRKERDPSALTPTAREWHELSHGQQRIWILDHIYESSAYNLTTAFRIEGAFQTTAFEMAVQTLIDRHESLRTVFAVVEGTPRQRILPKLPFRVAQTDVRATGGPAGIARAMIAESSQERFDLERGPLLRMRLYRTEAGAWILQLTMHHIITDEWSLGVLLHELLELYAGFAEGRTATLPALALQYKDYASGQRQFLASESGRRARAWWLANLPEKTPAEYLVPDFPRSGRAGFAGAHHRFVLSAAQTAALREIGQRTGASLFMVVLAAAVALLHRVSDREEIIVGSPVSGRSSLDLENQIGFFCNNLVLANRVSRGDSFASLVDSVKRSTLKAFDHQDYPYDCLVSDLEVAANSGRNPLFDLVVVLQQDERAKSRPEFLRALRSPLEVATLDLPDHVCRFDLVFNFVDLPDMLVDINYRTDLFLSETIELLAARLESLLAQVTADPLVPVSQLQFAAAAAANPVTLDFDFGERKGAGGAK